jgi:hypothetical protein
MKSLKQIAEYAADLSERNIWFAWMLFFVWLPLMIISGLICKVLGHKLTIITEGCDDHYFCKRCYWSKTAKHEPF